MRIKRIRDFPSYFITSTGEVYNWKTKRKMKPSCVKGYKRVVLYNNKKDKTFLIHRLVAQAFIPNPHNKPQVNHIDENPSNNDRSNLEWNTNEENCKWSMKGKKSYKTKPKGYYATKPTKRSAFKIICKHQGWNFEEFKEIWKGDKTKYYHKKYYYIEKVIDMKDSKTNKKWNPCIVPTSLIKSCARALQSGLDKGYRPQSYLDGDIEVYKNALYRHLISYLEGHIVDAESGLNVLDHISANVAILIELEKKNELPKLTSEPPVIECFGVIITNSFMYNNVEWKGKTVKCRSIYFGGYQVELDRRWVSIERHKFTRLGDDNNEEG